MNSDTRFRAAARVRRVRQQRPDWEFAADLLAQDLYLLDGVALTDLSVLMGLSRTETRTRLVALGTPMRPRGRQHGSKNR